MFHKNNAIFFSNDSRPPHLPPLFHLFCFQIWIWIPLPRQATGAPPTLGPISAARAAVPQPRPPPPLLPPLSLTFFCPLPTPIKTPKNWSTSTFWTRVTKNYGSRSKTRRLPLPNSTETEALKTRVIYGSRFKPVPERWPNSTKTRLRASAKYKTRASRWATTVIVGKAWPILTPGRALQAVERPQRRQQSYHHHHLNGKSPPGPWWKWPKKISSWTAVTIPTTTTSITGVNNLICCHQIKILTTRLSRISSNTTTTSRNSSFLRHLNLVIFSATRAPLRRVGLWNEECLRKTYSNPSVWSERNRRKIETDRQTEWWWWSGNQVNRLIYERWKQVYSYFHCCPIYKMWGSVN